MHERLWHQEEYVTAVASLSREHQMLRSQWNYVPDSADDKIAPVELKTRIEVISGLLINHFSNEEDLMRMIDFPGYENHKAEHRRITDAFQGLLIKIPASADRWSQAYTFLQDWAVDHGFSYDKILDKHIKQSLAYYG